MFDRGAIRGAFVERRAARSARPARAPRVRCREAELEALSDEAQRRGRRARGDPRRAHRARRRAPRRAARATRRDDACCACSRWLLRRVQLRDPRRVGRPDGRRSAAARGHERAVPRARRHAPARRAAASGEAADDAERGDARRSPSTASRTPPRRGERTRDGDPEVRPRSRSPSSSCSTRRSTTPTPSCSPSRSRRRARRDRRRRSDAHGRASEPPRSPSSTRSSEPSRRRRAVDAATPARRRAGCRACSGRRDHRPRARGARVDEERARAARPAHPHLPAHGARRSSASASTSRAARMPLVVLTQRDASRSGERRARLGRDRGAPARAGRRSCRSWWCRAPASPSRRRTSARFPTPSRRGRRSR